ncbi:MAG: hypothetical protein AB1806_04825 [Acidobacteriota bacterium]
MPDDCTPRPPHDLRADVDARIRAAFEPETGAAARVARAALAADAGSPPGTEVEHLSPARRRTGLRWVGVVAAAAVVILAASLALQPWRPVTLPEAATVTVGAPSLTGSFTDGVLVLSLPDGSVSITGGEARDERPPDGYGIVLVEGEVR